MTMTGRRTPAEDFTRLVQSYDERLRALAYRMLGDAHRMDDALQDAYVKAYRSYAEFRGDSDPRTWLYRIVHNCCVDLLRRERRYVHEPLDAIAADEAGPPVDFDDGGRLASALERLSTDHLTVVLLVDADGFDYAEAAEVLGIAVGTVASRLSRAHALLRSYLEEAE